MAPDQPRATGAGAKEETALVQGVTPTLVPVQGGAALGVRGLLF
jgi:hypothetical protein